MISYTMTTEQAERYDSGNHAVIDQLHRDIADMLADAGAGYAEIYHPGSADETGFVAWIYDPA